MNAQLIALWLTVSLAPAQAPPPPPPEQAPLETEASGLETPLEPEESAGRVAARVALYPVRGVWWVVNLPFRGLAYAFNRFQLKERYQAVFFSEDLTRGLVPTVSFQSGLGATGGLSFRWNDIEGSGATLKLKAAYGGEFLQSYASELSSGTLLGELVQLETLVEFREFPNSRFFGIGNSDGDEQSFESLNGRIIDPLTDPTAVATRYRHDTFSARLGGRIHVTDSISLLLSGAYRLRDFEENITTVGDARIDAAYDVNRLTGYTSGLSNLYSEALLTIDGREKLERYHSTASPSMGYLISGFYGFQAALTEEDPSEFGRWGVDLQRYINLYRGDRILVLRLYFEGVTGSLEEVPFIDLPALGGPVFLRGYRRDRFRERNIGLASVEYQYPISRNIRGYLFVDAGAPYRTSEDLRNWHEAPRIAYGGGLQFNTISSFIGRIIIGTNIDGGFQATFSFNPTFETTSREDNQ